MDTSATMDSLNDTPLPPELSFDDLLLDDSPVKKSSISNIMNDPLDFDEDEKRGPPGDETLHTPGSKKTKPPPVPVALAVATTTATETTISMASTTATATTTKYERPMIQPTETSAKTATTTTHPLVASATVNSPKLTTATGVTPTPTVLLNNRNILPKTAAVAAAAAANKIIKITPKSTTTATIPQGTTATATSVASLAGKAVKTSNGQIYYIQKKASVLPAVRLQQVGTTTAPGTSATTTAITTGQSIATVTAASTAGAAAKTTTSVTTNTNSNKTVAIQVIRAADGSLMPVKGTAATTLAVAAAATGKKIISNVGGQVLIKTPLRTVAGITSSAAAGDATGKTVKLQRIADSSSNIVPVTKTGGKIIVHSASGKQIVVSNQNLIKLSPKPTLTQQQTIGQTAGAASVTAGAASVSANGKMLQLSGKPLQYVRVFPNSKLTNNANANAAATSTTTTAIANSSATATTTSNTTATTATSKPAIRILNPLPPQKFTVVRPNAATKLVLTQSQSPKKEGGVTFSPVTSKVQKTIVTLPTQQRIVDDDKSSPTNTPISSSGSSSNNNSRQSLIRHSNNINSNNNSAPATYTSLIRKPNISEINSEIKRITSTPASVNEHHGRSSSGNGSGIGSPTEIKRNVNGNNIVVVSRSSNLPPLQPRSSLNSMVQGTLTNTYSNSNSNQQPKKLYSVLKNNNTSSTSSSFVTALSANSIGERKSLLISVQEQALLSQQHHKSVQLKRQLQSSPSASSSLLHSSGGNSNSNQANANYNSKTASSSSATSNSNKFIPMKIKEEPIDSNDMKPLPTDDGVLRRKHCNCSKSQCLKLYCDCFANGEFCQDCTCKDCFNNLQYEDERQRAIKNCLERNPSAFKPKITTSRDSGDMRLHNKGCNCKRSGCLKNYCECYEAKIPCSSNCKCVGCRNIEERPDLDMDPIDPKILATIANASGGAAPQVGLKRSYDKANSKMGGAAGVSDKMLKEAAKAYTFNNNDFISGSGSSTSITGSNSTTTVGHGHGGAIGGPPPEKQQCNFITQEVVDATIQCMLSQADECDKNGLPAYQTEKMVMEEMGRCLVEIIDFSIRNTDTSFSQE